MGLSKKVEAVTDTTKFCRDRLISLCEKMCKSEPSICSALQVSHEHSYKSQVFSDVRL